MLLKPVKILVFIGVLILLFYAPILAAHHAAALEVFSGKVVGVVDGDSIKVMHDGKAEQIRLNGIDCPERRQSFGKRAKEATSQLAFGKEVTVKPKTQDKYKRTVAEVELPDGTNLNQELVKQGWCWWFRKYAPNDETLKLLEEEATKKKLGLWIEPNPVTPWDFREARGEEAAKKKRQKGEKKRLNEGSAFGLSSSSSFSVPELTQRWFKETPVTVSPDASSIYRLPILGNRRSGIYHRPDCPNYGEIAPKNKVSFDREEEAVAEGYRLALNCP
ncbi:MAG: thermonuclease family protein [Nitrospira sp.]